MDTMITIGLVVLGCMIFVSMIASIIVLSEDLRKAENSINALRKESLELENRMLSMYAGTTDAIQHIEEELQNKEDRWDAGKSYSACQDWDEHK